MEPIKVRMRWEDKFLLIVLLCLFVGITGIVIYTVAFDEPNNDCPVVEVDGRRYVCD